MKKKLQWTKAPNSCVKSSFQHYNNHTLNDFPFTTTACYWEWVNKSRRNTVWTIRVYTHGNKRSLPKKENLKALIQVHTWNLKNQKEQRTEADLRGSKNPITNVVTSRASSWESTGELSRFDDCSTTLLDSCDEFAIKPVRTKGETVSSRPGRKIINSNIQVFLAFLIYHSSSATSSRTGFSPVEVFTVAWLTSGYWVDEWLPQMITFFTSLTWTLSLSEI